ncbi:pentatricopeptide repeat-containing protein [Tanacetum coccineum]|uniref:Pentatricopeptide repeat-containing protein n=1 Tax=Tanacetum coccineum TaxID=301880 RepID=A0ABQ5D8L8_9ASTR
MRLRMRVCDYGVCERWEGRYAVRIHEGMMEKNVMLWSAMTNAYMKASGFEDGFGLFREMRRENGIKVVSSTLTVVFEGCGRSDSRLGDLDSASKLFIVMEKKDNVSRNSLIGG